MTMLHTPTSATPPQQIIASQSGDVLIPIGNITTTTTYYTYDSGGVAIRYFLVKDGQGTVRGALDACDVCYAAKKGYRQIGDRMHCLNCGREFAISSLGTENTPGGCWPSYLPMTTTNGNVSIRTADLLAKQFMFE
jgi:uncharacterized membrane protein